MAINIYSIKHPLALNWMSQLLNSHVSQYHKQELINKISIALIYEATRRSIQHKKLYIKYINYIHETYMIDRCNIVVFCTSINICQIVSKDLQYLIPNLKLYPFIIKQLSTTNSWEIITEQQHLSSAINKNSQIIILSEELQASKIKALIKHITSEYYIINNIIQICCAICNHSELDNLSSTKTNLDIYTSYITTY
uniref:Uracil phosphoribosyltransferase n=1 Tax=Hommersandiophycus borowitzkae TaxID=268573 RepID=A0A1G4NUF5_9FLOR|nr:Uracil phosphoribosyltransferase [Hommersandiophycus borowitzkae]SCW22265.1 Uracil phosphoribosyltransferase [Hommersandiophycus borowitzkae]